MRGSIDNDEDGDDDKDDDVGDDDDHDDDDDDKKDDSYGVLSQAVSQLLRVLHLYFDAFG